MAAISRRAVRINKTVMWDLSRYMRLNVWDFFSPTMKFDLEVSVFIQGVKGLETKLSWQTACLTCGKPQVQSQVRENLLGVETGSNKRVRSSRSSSVT